MFRSLTFAVRLGTPGQRSQVCLSSIPAVAVTIPNLHAIQRYHILFFLGDYAQSKALDLAVLRLALYVPLMRPVVVAFALLLPLVSGCASCKCGDCLFGLLGSALDSVLDPAPKDTGTRQNKVDQWEYASRHQPLP